MRLQSAAPRGGEVPRHAVDGGRSRSASPSTLSCEIFVTRASSRDGQMVSTPSVWSVSQSVSQSLRSPSGGAELHYWQTTSPSLARPKRKSPFGIFLQMCGNKRERRGGNRGSFGALCHQHNRGKVEIPTLNYAPKSCARAQRHHNQHRGADVAVDSAAPGAKLLGPRVPRHERVAFVARGKTLASQKWDICKNTPTAATAPRGSRHEEGNDLFPSLLLRVVSPL